MTQEEIIIKYLEDLGDWQYEYKIRSIPTQHGFIGARGDRDVRQLIEDKKVEADMKGKYRIVRAWPRVKKFYGPMPEDQAKAYKPKTLSL